MHLTPSARAQAMSRGVSPITIVWSRGRGAVPARRRAIGGSAPRSSESDPNAPWPPGSHRPIPARLSFSRATGSKLPVRSASVTPSRAASQGSSSAIPGSNPIDEVGRADLGVDPAARLAHVVGALVDPPRGHASVEQDQRGRSRRRSGPRVRSAGADPSCGRRAPHGSPRSSASLWASVAPDISVPSMSNSSSMTPASALERACPARAGCANAAIRRAAASTSVERDHLDRRVHVAAAGPRPGRWGCRRG